MNAKKPITIFIVRFDPKEADRKKAFHSSCRNFLNMMIDLVYEWLNVRKSYTRQSLLLGCFCLFLQNYFLIMSTFYKLTIKEVKRETAEAISVAFNIPAELKTNYKFTAGQYV